MKKTILIIIAAIAAFAGWAQKPADVNKAVVNIVTYDAEGNVLGNAYGFFSSADGEAVVPYHVLKGAVRADIINWQGAKSQVMRIIGASSDYDLVRVSTNASTKKLVSLICGETNASVSDDVHVAYYTNDKKALPDTAHVTAADLYKEHYYYDLTTPNESRYFGCPVLNAEGKVVAIVQKNVLKGATTACAIDVNFATSLSTNALTALTGENSDIRIPKRLPQDEDDAFSYVYMALRSQLDSAIVITATDDFIAAFPKNSAVFSARANYYANHGDYVAADADLQRGIAIGGDNLSDVYYNQSVLMYNKMLFGAADVYPQWTLDTALDAAEKAYAAQPQPLYVLQQGQVLFSQQKFEEAYRKFSEVNASDIASYRTFYYAANALERAGGDDAEVIALLDSVVSRLPHPYTNEAAPYLLARAQHLDNSGQHRRAVADYNEYEKILGGRELNDYFYYLRMQAEIGSRMYQQALDDGASAIARATSDESLADYLYEVACLQLQVGLYDECIGTCERLLSLAPSHAEGYKICGVAYGEKKQKAKAVEYLKKAADHGAENAAVLLEKYK